MNAFLDNIRNFNNITLPMQLSAYKKEFEEVKNFLISYKNNKETFNSYRRELEKFLQWTYSLKDKSLFSITTKDIEEYIKFCQNPPKHWISDKNIKRFIIVNGERRSNPKWLPFYKPSRQIDYKLSENALKAMFAVLNSFFSFLIEERHIMTNPVRKIRQKSKYFTKTQTFRPIRRLSSVQLDYLLKTTEEMASNDPKRHEKTLFITQLTFKLFLRVSELIKNKYHTPIMSDFYQDQENNWWFRVIGKGNKERDIALSGKSLELISRWRKHLGLSELPTPCDMSPIVPKGRNKGAVSSSHYIRYIINKALIKTKEALIRDGLIEEAKNMDKVTPHWLRHTGISEAIKYRPRDHVRDDAGHSSSLITDRYINIERKDRHASAQYQE